jgi:hypothetical protein
MFKAILFDFDYTLGNSEEGIILSSNYALTQMGYPEAERDAICRTIGLTSPGMPGLLPYRLALQERPPSLPAGPHKAYYPFAEKSYRP